VVAALGSPGGAANVLDHFGLPADTDHARALLRHATRAARAVGVEEAVVFAPAGHTLDSAAARPLAGALAAAGWRLLVVRRHYEFEPAAGLAEGLSTGLRFERLMAADDPRLAEVHRQVMDETLDEHQRSLISRMGFDAACDAALQGLLEADPVDCIRLAVDDTGAAVGMVSGLTVSTGRGFVLFVGVAREHRGRGYGRQLLAWMTRELLAEGALTLIADTDHDNVPMGAAFEAVGWPQTETRIDLVPDVPS
jgi:ribosomal protein S18 acetylase RimI-like enzyme